MPTFKDTQGRDWEVKITARRLTQLRELLGYPISVTWDEDGTARMKAIGATQDAEAFIGVLYALLGDQLEKKGVTREQFEEGFDGSVWRKSSAAFLDAIMDFSLRPAVLRELFGTGEEILDRLNSISKNEPTNLPAPPESTPQTTDSAPSTG